MYFTFGEGNRDMIGCGQCPKPLYQIVGFQHGQGCMVCHCLCCWRALPDGVLLSVTCVHVCHVPLIVSEVVAVVRRDGDRHRPASPLGAKNTISNNKNPKGMCQNSVHRRRTSSRNSITAAPATPP